MRAAACGRTTCSWCSATCPARAGRRRHLRQGAADAGEQRRVDVPPHRRLGRRSGTACSCTASPLSVAGTASSREDLSYAWTLPAETQGRLQIWYGSVIGSLGPGFTFPRRRRARRLRKEYREAATDDPFASEARLTSILMRELADVLPPLAGRGSVKRHVAEVAPPCGVMSSRFARRDHPQGRTDRPRHPTARANARIHVHRTDAERTHVCRRADTDRRLPHQSYRGIAVPVPRARGAHRAQRRLDADAGGAPERTPRARHQGTMYFARQERRG